MEEKPLRVLIIEDSEDDALLLIDELRTGRLQAPLQPGGNRLGHALRPPK